MKDSQNNRNRGVRALPEPLRWGNLPSLSQGGEALSKTRKGSKSRAKVDKKADVPPELTIEHLLDHTPMLSSCKWCQMAKSARKGAYKKKFKEPDREPKCFGEVICADHLICQNERSRGICGERDALVIGDRWSEWISGYPVTARNANE